MYEDEKSGQIILANKSAHFLSDAARTHCIHAVGLTSQHRILSVHARYWIRLFIPIPYCFHSACKFDVELMYPRELSIRKARSRMPCFNPPAVYCCFWPEVIWRGVYTSFIACAIPLAQRQCCWPRKVHHMSCGPRTSQTWPFIYF